MPDLDMAQNDRIAAELPEEHKEQEHKPIPGEHDHETEPSTPKGIVGGTGFGNDLPLSNVDPTLDDEDRKEIRWESGGRLPKGDSRK